MKRKNPKEFANAIKPDKIIYRIKERIAFMKISRKVLPALIISIFAVFLASCTICVSVNKDTHVVILATSDIHGNIWGYSYGSDAETGDDGMARLYTYISKVRKQNDIVFLVDAGDEIQGNVMTDDIANKAPDNEHPVMSAMNYIGYDAMTVGNHEFDWGIDTMEKILQQADFPILGANVRDKDEGCVTGDDWVVIERGGVRLAVIGVCTPDVPMWDGDKEGVADTVFEPADVAVGNAIKEIGDKADIILVSAHMGQYAEYDQTGQSDSGEKIVQENPKVDILQLGHMHITVNDRIGEVPAVAVRNAGKEIARIDVTLDKDNNIKDISTSIVSMKDYEPSDEIRDIPVVKELHEQAKNFVKDGAGTDTVKDKGELLGISSAKFQPENEIKGIPEGRLKDTAVVDLILNVQLQRSGADVTAGPLYKDTSDLPEGEIYYSDINDIYPFDNVLCTLYVTGAELKRYMEWSAAAYNRWKPGDINISFNPDHPGYMQDYFAGVDYDINLSRPEGERIENVMFKGKPLGDDQILKLAVNNYRYASVIKPLKFAKGYCDWESAELIRDMIADYISDNSPVTPTVDNNWRITGVDLSEDDPRRAKIIEYINEGSLPAPYNESCNLSSSSSLVGE